MERRIVQGVRGRIRALTWGVLAAALLPGGAVAQGLTVTEVEPNGAIAQATVVPLTTATISGKTNRAGDLDFFQTEFTAGNVLRITLGPFNEQFTGRIQVFNSSGVLIAERQRDPATASSSTLIVDVTASTPPGVGYIRVSNDVSDGVTAENDYTLTVAQGRAEVEPNDDAGSTDVLGAEFPTLGTLWRGPPQDPEEPPQDPEEQSDDVFVFTSTEEDTTAIVSLEYPLGDALSLAIALYDSELNLLGFDFRNSISPNNGPQNPALVLPLPVAGTYLVQVTPVSDPGAQQSELAYALSLRLKTGPYEAEPNQSFLEAVPLPLSGNGSPAIINGTLQTAQDVDVYLVSVPGGQQLVVDLDSASSVEILDSVVSLFLREDSGLSFASGNDSSLPAPGATFSLINRDGYVRLVPPRGGDIFIAVGDLSNRGAPDGFDYRLSVRVETPIPNESEPNDTAAAAGRLEDAQPVRAVVGNTADVDVYLLEGEAGDSLQVNVAALGIGSFLDPTILVRDPTGAVVAANDNAAFSTDPFLVIPSLPMAGDYSIELRQQAGNTGSGASFYYEIRAVTTRLLSALLRNPDIDASARVDGFDLAILSRAFGTQSGDPGYVVAADIFPDACNCIDGLDLAVLGDFFGAALPATGIGNLLSDPPGDAIPFFGPATRLPDVIALNLAIAGVDPNRTAEIGAFFDGGSTEGVAGLLSVDSDESALTGSVGTPDAYAGERDLGSDLEILFDSETAQVLSVPDARGDIFPAFAAKIGDTTAPRFPRGIPERDLPRTTLLAELPTVASGGTLSFSMPLSLLGGTERAAIAMLGLSEADVEPTDRLPNRGILSLTPPFALSSVTTAQRVCGNPTAPALPASIPRVLCDVDADCTAPQVCLDVDNLPVGTPNPLVAGSVVLRTPTGPPLYRDFERGVCAVGSGCFAGIDAGGNQHNDTLDRVFPLGTRPLSDSTLKWYTRDLLPNMSIRDGFFDAHASGVGLPPPDVDFYYFVGASGDVVIVDLSTADDGASFNAMIELYRTPLPLSVLDPSTDERLLSLNFSEITLLATTDDQGADLDPRLQVTLPSTGIYVVRVAASPAQTTFPGASVNYTLQHQSLRPDEFSIPVVLRGPLTTSRPTTASSLAGLRFELTYDPKVVEFTGIDLGLGTRENNAPIDRTLSTAQEYIGERIADSPGRMAVALRSMTGFDFLDPNGISALATNAERILLRLRFRAVGEGTTRIQFATNSTTPGAPRANLGIDADDPPRIFLPALAFGPGVQVTVTGATPLTPAVEPGTP